MGVGGGQQAYGLRTPPDGGPEEERVRLQPGGETKLVIEVEQVAQGPSVVGVGGRGPSSLRGDERQPTLL